VISQTAEYALRAVLVLGSHRDGPLTTRQIAARTRVPAGYLSKVLQALGRARLVEAQRGLGGGYVLTRPLEEVTVLDVINAVDPVQRIDRCPLGLPAHEGRMCSLHQRLDQGIALMESLFGRTTIGQLLADENPSRPLCEAAIDTCGTGTRH
jgi:Rrf2 family protein